VVGLARARDEQRSTPATKGNLANALADMGRRSEARRLYEEVLAGQTAELGPAHTDTLLAKGNLANLLQELGERAQPLQVSSDPQSTSPAHIHK
jgi:hypothetical protein